VEYAVPVTPPGSDDVVIERGATPWAMVTVKDLAPVSFGDDESATRIVKLDDPAVVGVPESVPPALRFKPFGRTPEEMLQLYGATPPVAVRVEEYEVPVVPFGSEEVVMVGSDPADATLIVNDCSAVCAGADESTTSMLNVDACAVVGTPETVPLFESMLRPAGRLPTTVAQV